MALVSGKKIRLDEKLGLIKKIAPVELQYHDTFLPRAASQLLCPTKTVDNLSIQCWHESSSVNGYLNLNFSSWNEPFSRGQLVGVVVIEATGDQAFLSILESRLLN